MKKKSVAANMTSFLLTILLSYTVSIASVPGQMNYQGYLTDGEGTPVNGDYTITFSFYTIDTGGVAFWTETQVITIIDGSYTAILGQPGNQLNPSNFDGNIFLGISVYPDPEMVPRLKLTSTGFAMKAADSDTLAGQGPGDFDQSDHVSQIDNPHDVTAAQIGAVSIGNFAWDNLQNIPSDFTDGNISWDEISSIPLDFTDGKIGWDEVFAIPLDFIDGKISWAELTGIPEGGHRVPAASQPGCS